MTAHRHMAAASTDACWDHCIAESDICPDGRAHGNIVRHDACRCGAIRRTEINGPYRVSTGWLETEK